MLVVDRRQAASGAREQLPVQHAGLDTRTVQGFPLGPAYVGGKQKFAYWPQRRFTRKSAADPRR